jgi:hypothetical protein
MATTAIPRCQESSASEALGAGFTMLRMRPIALDVLKRPQGTRPDRCRHAGETPILLPFDHP